MVNVGGGLRLGFGVWGFGIWIAMDIRLRTAE